MNDTFEFIDAEYATSTQNNHLEAASIVQMCGFPIRVLRLAEQTGFGHNAST